MPNRRATHWTLINDRTDSAVRAGLSMRPGADGTWHVECDANPALGLSTYDSEGAAARGVIDAFAELQREGWRLARGGEGLFALTPAT